MPNLASALKATQKKFGMTGKELSRLTGISESAISDIRRGVSDPQWSTIARLIAAIDKLHPGAWNYFFQKLAGQSPLTTPNNIDPETLADFVKHLPSEQVPLLLLALAEKYRDLAQDSSTFAIPA